jgi:hypothetical protein
MYEKNKTGLGLGMLWESIETSDSAQCLLLLLLVREQSQRKAVEMEDKSESNESPSLSDARFTQRGKALASKWKNTLSQC